MTDLKTELLNATLQQFLPVLLTAVTTLAAWVLKKLADLLKAKGAESKWALALQQLTDVVGHVVADADKTLKPMFVKAMEDGTLSPEEGAALKAEVMRLIKERLAPETLALLKSQMGPLFETILSGAIEKAVSALNSSSSSPADIAKTLADAHAAGAKAATEAQAATLFSILTESPKVP